jgi:hypothetical protein
MSISGCTTPTPEDNMEHDGGGVAGVPLVQSGETPPEPPVVRVGSKVIEPLSFYWIIDGAVRHHTPENDAEIAVPRVVSDGDALTFEVGHPTIPSGLSVEVFDQLDERDHPTGAGRKVDCLVGGEGCSVEAQPSHLVVTVSLRGEGRLAVLTATYPVLAEVAGDLGDLPAFLTVSWGVVSTG